MGWSSMSTCRYASLSLLHAAASTSSSSASSRTDWRRNPSDSFWNGMSSALSTARPAGKSSILLVSGTPFAVFLVIGDLLVSAQPARLLNVIVGIVEGVTKVGKQRFE